MATNAQNQEWTQVLEPTDSALRFNIKELWRYRDLIALFVRRDFIAVYKQTILGPFWHFIQPLATTAAYAFLGGIAGISSDGLPRILFVLTGVVLWNYFSSCLTKTSNTFVGNAHIFGKVYFPRLAIPISIILSNLMSFFIQLILLVPFLIYYHQFLHPNLYLLALPLLVVVVAMLGLGFGIIVSSLTIRYRDLIYLISFGVQLAVYSAPVIFPLSFLHGKIRTLCLLNPLTPFIEMFRYALFGKGTFSLESVAYGVISALVVTVLGIVLFNRVERSFMDTV